MDVLQIKNLNKKFGDNEVLKGLSLSVPDKSVFGFVGQNGSGKTTTMNIILGLLKPESGEVSVMGEAVRYGDTKTNRHIGYLPDVPEFYGYMTAYEYLRLSGEISGMSADKIKKRSGELLELVGLGKTKKSKRISGYSRGMKQRLGIAQALLNEPDLLICDEPTSALDPAGRKEILEILSVAKEKTTVLFSTHILSDVERICDNAAILHNGKCAVSGSLSSLKESRRHEIIEVYPYRRGELKRISEGVAKLDAVSGVECGSESLKIHVTDAEEASIRLTRYFAGEGIALMSFEILEMTLESLFMEVTA